MVYIVNFTHKPVILWYFYAYNTIIYLLKTIAKPENCFFLFKIEKYEINFGAPTMNPAVQLFDACVVMVIHSYS